MTSAVFVHNPKWAGNQAIINVASITLLQKPQVSEKRENYKIYLGSLFATANLSGKVNVTSVDFLRMRKWAKKEEIIGCDLGSPCAQPQVGGRSGN